MGLQEDLLHDLARHRCDTEWPVVPWILLCCFCFGLVCLFVFPFFKMGVIFPLFQSVGTSPDCHDLWNMMDSGLATSSTSSLRIHGWISSGPIDLCTFMFLKWSQICSSPTADILPTMNRAVWVKHLQQIEIWSRIRKVCLQDTIFQLILERNSVN